MMGSRGGQHKDRFGIYWNSFGKHLIKMTVPPTIPFNDVSTWQRLQLSMRPHQCPGPVSASCLICSPPILVHFPFPGAQAVLCDVTVCDITALERASPLVTLPPEEGAQRSQRRTVTKGREGFRSRDDHLRSTCSTWKSTGLRTGAREPVCPKLRAAVPA